MIGGALGDQEQHRAPAATIARAATTASPGLLRAPAPSAGIPSSRPDDSPSPLTATFARAEPKPKGGNRRSAHGAVANVFGMLMKCVHPNRSMAILAVMAYSTALIAHATGGPIQPDQPPKAEPRPEASREFLQRITQAYSKSSSYQDSGTFTMTMHFRNGEVEDPSPYKGRFATHWTPKDGLRYECECGGIEKEPVLAVYTVLPDATMTLWVAQRPNEVQRFQNATDASFYQPRVITRGASDVVLPLLVPNTFLDVHQLNTLKVLESNTDAGTIRLQVNDMTTFHIRVDLDTYLIQRATVYLDAGPVLETVHIEYRAEQNKAITPDTGEPQTVKLLKTKSQ